MNRASKLAAVAATITVMLGGVSACSSAGGHDGAAVSVVASTDVYGDIVTALAGDLSGSRVRITSIITDPGADPHSYEANTRNQLEISRADLIIENGGGYDDFIGSMRASSGAEATVLDAVRISGHTAPAGGDLNEHVWYDFPTVARLATRITDVLAAKDPRDAATFRTNARAFTARLTALEHREGAVRSAHAGGGVAITEPVPLYLLQACGLVNRTPAGFSEAIEDGTDVAPRVLKQTLGLFSGHEVRLLAYNEQTSSPETEKVLAAAHDNHVPVVPVTETLPQGEHYLDWMAHTLTAVEQALAPTI